LFSTKQNTRLHFLRHETSANSFLRHKSSATHFLRHKSSAIRLLHDKIGGNLNKKQSQSIESEVQVRFLSIFCTACLYQWMLTHFPPTCPTCRNLFYSENVTTLSSKLYCMVALAHMGAGAKPLVDREGPWPTPSFNFFYRYIHNFLFGSLKKWVRVKIETLHCSVYRQYIFVRFLKKMDGSLYVFVALVVVLF
jgi:hypothetical protein